MCPNQSMNFRRDSSSACHRLASTANVIRCDRLVAYYALKHSTRVSKMSMDLGESPPYQVNVAPLRDVEKTQHKIALSLVYRFSWVRKESKCSSGSMVSSYYSRLSGFQPRGMLASMMRSIKGWQWAVILLQDGGCERDLGHLECWLCVEGCDSSWVRSGNVWAECSST